MTMHYTSADAKYVEEQRLRRLIQEELDARERREASSPANSQPRNPSSLGGLFG